MLDIEQLTPGSPLALIRATEQTMNAVFPEYAPNRLERRLGLFGNPAGDPCVQVFVVPDADRVAAFVQLVYRSIDDALVCNLDLLGTAAGYRRQGLAERLLHKALDEALAYACRRGQILSGLLTLITVEDPAIRGLHIKHGGQIRTDRRHVCGDVVVWYPLTTPAPEIPTTALLSFMDAFARVVGQFG